TIVIVEVEIAADVNDTLQIRQLERMPEPRAAVHDGNGAHPVGMLVDHEQVERLFNAAQEGQRYMVKISGAEKRERRLVASANNLTKLLLETSKRVEAAGQPNPRAPTAKVHYFGVKTAEEITLGYDSAV